MTQTYLDKVDPSLSLGHTKRDEQLQAREQVTMAAASRAVIHDWHRAFVVVLVVGQDGTLTLESNVKVGESLLHVGYCLDWCLQCQERKASEWC